MNATMTMGELSPLSVRELLRSLWPVNTTKQAARAADVPLDTAKCWVGGRSCMSADKLLRMAARDPSFNAELRRVLEQLDQERDAVKARLATLESTHAVVAREAMDRGKPMGRGSRGGVPAGVGAAAGVARGGGR